MISVRYTALHTVGTAKTETEMEMETERERETEREGR
jgi:hypothetical protein